MDVNSLIDPGANGGSQHPSGPNRYPTRNSMNVEGVLNVIQPNNENTERNLPGLTQLSIPPPNQQAAGAVPQLPSGPPKLLRLVYLLDNGETSRLSLTTRFNPHDTTKVLLEIVQSFFALYRPFGFQDENGDNITPSYENFKLDHTVYVRSGPGIPEHITQYTIEPTNQSPTKTFPMLPPASNQPLSRPGYKSTGSVQLAPGFEYSPQVSPTKATTFDGPAEFSDHRGTDEWLMKLPDNVEEDEDENGGSKIASAEISEANIVDGGRRKRAKFDTQDLPLFQPMQVPSALSMSSASPVRRPPPQGAQSDGYALSHTDTTPNRATSQRGSFQGRRRGVIPTPDHTSVMSDEDVAWQLLSLSENGHRNSKRGRTSTSTVDDANSGQAIISDVDNPYSSEEEESRSPIKVYQDEPGRAHGRARADDESSADEYNDDDDRSTTDRRKGSKASLKTSKSHKASKTGQLAKKESSASRAPPSPKSLSASSRKPSNGSLGFTTPLTPLGPDETDLSSKPRCQRCRKSKKGCDRARPCGRCKDAGLTADDCVSEEETNNKKGRYGRHMGVAIKKQSASEAAAAQAQVQAFSFGASPSFPPRPPFSKTPALARQYPGMDDYQIAQAEKNKKRKR